MSDYSELNKRILDVLEQECESKSPDVKKVIERALNKELYYSASGIKSSNQVNKDYDAIFSKVLKKV